MKTFFLSFPRLNISLTAPEAIAADIQAAFLHSINPDINLPPRDEYIIESTPSGFSLFKTGQPARHFGSSIELICRLEEDIENTLIRVIGDWDIVSHPIRMMKIFLIRLSGSVRRPKSSGFEQTARHPRENS